MYNTGKRFKGFTLVEILIAASILSMFIAGVFSFYRMGSRMFTAGSWRLQKQKEAERFLNLLKERIEQASNASGINPAGTPQVVVSDSTFVTVKNNTEVASLTADTRLLLFSVCKPDMSVFGANVGPGTGPGLIMYHCLLARPNEKNLYTLYLHADTTKNAHNGIDYFNSTADFEPDLTKFSSPLGNFNAAPADFSLIRAPYTAKLSDVLTASFSVEIASGTDGMTETEKVIGLSITMQHPKYPGTTVNQGIKAKIDFSVKVNELDLGGF
jgi:prepilin-type N-terminal cleavage/methylation domain-containing protein